MLDAEGWRVAQAADGLEALAYLRQQPRPDLILLDLIMPRMDGWEFRAVQKKDPNLAAIPVVLLTAVPDAGQLTRSLQPACCLAKPVQHSLLIEAVEYAC